jgi:threonylcarbamoyladenosine tRNA methylthiotransferase MtaB
VKVYLRTFGCRANQYDTEAVRTMLEEHGHAIVPSAAEADVAVFNSCAVTSDAEAELRKVVRRAARETPALRSVVMGCAAALDDDRPVALQLRRLPSVARVVGGADMAAIAEALDLPSAPGGVRTRQQSGTRALLRIQDGCDEHCTFCATTLARGANRSRAADEIVREATALAERHPEIVITGIHIGTYGADIGSSLGALMTELVRSVPWARFRLSSVEATELDEALTDLLVGSPEHVAPHVHAPLQSASDGLLRRMGRHWYTSATYSDAVERLAARMSILGLGADIIAGFPGETDADHRATVDFVNHLPFTYLHVFPYSMRPGTAAVRLPSHVPPALAQEWAAELREIGAGKARAYAMIRDGGAADVIAIGPTETAGRREGLTGDYLTVDLVDTSVPRGMRFAAVLARQDGRLTASAAGRSAFEVSRARTN